MGDIFVLIVLVLDIRGTTSFSQEFFSAKSCQDTAQVVQNSEFVQKAQRSFVYCAKK